MRVQGNSRVWDKYSFVCSGIGGIRIPVEPHRATKPKRVSRDPPPEKELPFKGFVPVLNTQTSSHTYVKVI